MQNAIKLCSSSDKRLPKVLGTIRELPKQRGSLEKLKEDWSNVGAEEDNGGDAAERGEQVLSKTTRSECLG